MALDPEVVESIVDAVRSHGQPDTVSKRLLAWLTAMSTTELSRDRDAELFSAVADVIDVSRDRDAL
jgi:hypothetical protein